MTSSKKHSKRHHKNSPYQRALSRYYDKAKNHLVSEHSKRHNKKSPPRRVLSRHYDKAKNHLVSEHSKRHHKKSPPRRVLSRYYDKAKLMLQNEDNSSSSNQYMLILLLRCVLCVMCIVTICFCGYLTYLASRVVMEYRAIFDPVKVTDDDIIAMLLPSYSVETYICIGIFGFAVYLIMASLQGLHGAVMENKMQIKLYFYCLLFPVVIGGTVALILAFAIADDARNNYVTWAYETGLRHLYGSEAKIDVWSFAVDIVQKEKKCCGYNASSLAKNNNTATYLTILFWLENTNWGAKQVDAINYNESATVEFVPKSCCKEQKPGCNLGVLYDRLTWDDEKERQWAARIYNVGCRGRLPGLGEFYFGLGNPLFTIFYVTMTALLVSMVVAFILTRKIQDVD